MKVALIDPLVTWKYDLGLAKELVQIGAEVTLITSAGFPQVDPAFFDGPMHRDFPNIRAYASSFAKGLYYLAGINKVIWRLWTGGFDVIHWQLFNIFPPVETYMAKMLFGLRDRLVMTVHDIVPWSSVKGRSHFWLRETYKAAGRLIVHHETNLTELSATFRLSPGRIRVVPHGSVTHFMTADLSPQCSRQKLGFPAQGRFVLFLGEIRPEKGLAYLVRAFKDVRAQMPDAHLVIAGRPRHLDMAEYLSELDHPKLRGSVTTRFEYIPDELVETYLSMADIVVLPYVAITQSGVLLEAMTVGRPVVVTDVGAIGATVQEVQAGCVVPPGEVKPLAEAIIDLLQHPEQARRMGQNGRRAARDVFSWANCARDTMAVYRELIGTP